MSDTNNTDGTTESVEAEGAYTDEHGTQGDVEQQISTEKQVSTDSTVDGEYTDEHGPDSPSSVENGHA